MNSSATPRSTYHHGDLRNALIEAGVALAEQGGPEAVGVRAAAREVGVTPTAAYRHFADAAALLHEVRLRALQLVLDTMVADMTTYPPSEDPGIDAIRRLAALGRAYIHTGVEHPGLFRASLGGDMPVPTQRNAALFDRLVDTVDDLAATGFVDPAMHPTATMAVWSAVHGFVRLVIDGTFADLPADQVLHIRETVVEMAIRGIGRVESPLYPRVRAIIATTDTAGESGRTEK